MQQGPERVLLVDEDISQYSQFVRLIEQLGARRYQLSWCSSLEQAADTMCAGIYDVIFLDASHDHLRSRRVLSTALAQGCKVPVIALSDSTRVEARNKVLSAGAIDYLNKDQLEATILERVIRYAIGSSGAEFKALRLNHLDPLTGVSNRLLFLDHFAKAIKRAERDRSSMALMGFDLDGFKQVNESYGHDAGDKLIELIAERLLACLSQSDSIARLGGDEFALLIEEIDDIEDIIALTEKITDAMSCPFQVAGRQLIISSSLGIAVYPEAGHEVDTLLKNADLARQRAKTMRGSTCYFFSQQMDVEVHNRSHREADLRRALRRNEFCLFYQPRVALFDDRIIGVEALIRWQHPELGLVNPDEFIPLAEETGLISAIGYWVVQQVCEDINRMDELGMPPLEVALNLSFTQFQDDGFTDRVTRIIQKSNVDARRIEFELTETALIANTEVAERCMRTLNRLGSSFSLDDFGTGYSSFAHIQRLPISALKVDRSFIQNLIDNEGDAKIVVSIIKLAHSLDMIVIAEGTEREAQVQFLRAHGCDQVQGYFFSPPLAFDALYEFICAEEALSV